MSEIDVIKTFWELNRGGVDAEGVRVPNAVASKDGKLGVYAMAMYGPETGMEIYAAVARVLVGERPDELVFALDRFARPGQGVRTGDFLSVHHWTGRAWRFGVIAYQYEPPIFDPIDWDNAFWRNALTEEMARTWGRITAAPHREPSPAMAVPVVVERFHVPQEAAS